MFEIQQDGFLNSRSGASFAGSGNHASSISGELYVRGNLYLSKTTLTAAYNAATAKVHVNIPFVTGAPTLNGQKGNYISSNTAYISLTRAISSDANPADFAHLPINVRFEYVYSHPSNPNKVYQWTKEEIAERYTGRLIVVTNEDDLATVGELEIPPHTTVLYIFDGYSWVDIEALNAPMKV